MSEEKKDKDAVVRKLSEPVVKKKKTKKQLEAERKKQIKEMEKHVKAHGDLVQKSICKKCFHCSNRQQKKKIFYTTDSVGNKIPFYPMNKCSLTGISMVDVKECELFVDCKTVS